MFDIIQFESEPKLGFEKFFKKTNLIISDLETTTEASKIKNKKTLILLKDFQFDEGVIKEIALKKKACFLIDLSRLDRVGLPRSIFISKVRNFLKLCNKYGAYYSFASFQSNEKKLRSASELLHLAMLFDINRGQAKFALKMLQHYQKVPISV